MDGIFQIEVPRLNKIGQVRKAPFDLSILREEFFAVSVERLPLIEYFVFFDDSVKAEQIKVKLYKTLAGRWYDKNYSEEAEVYSPEFGLPEVNSEIKKAIDTYESEHKRIGEFA
jgi:hypothetical protein